MSRNTRLARMMQFAMTVLFGSCVAVWAGTVNEREEQGIRLAVDAEYRSAIAKFEHWVEQEPTSSRADYYIGVCRLHLGEVREAVDAFEKSLRNGADFPEVHYWLARAFWRLNDQAAARTALHNGLGFFPENDKLKRLTAEWNLGNPVSDSLR